MNAHCEDILRTTATLRIALVALLVSPSLLTAQDAVESFFVESVQPIFKSKCYPCHGPNSQKSSYRLDVKDIALRGGDHGEPPIIRGNSQASPLFQYVANDQTEFAMPPKDSQIEQLTDRERESLRSWIDQGAVWPDSANTIIDNPKDWWSFQSLSPSDSNRNWTENPIDAIIQTELTKHGLTLSPPAAPRVLARRLYFDLIGLPPTPESSDEFERDSSLDPDKAVENLVDRLLDMPQYGERWARHWLDVVHYGDTHGYDKDKPRNNAWPYRDYVIRALNSDKPYARFVQEQIAGDVLWPESVDGIEAVGFISAGPWDFIGHAELPETKIDGKTARHLDRDDMVSNAIGTFCSLTVHCAQCHQHKFDPITQEDYYRLQSVFAALDRTDRKYYRDNTLQSKFAKLSERQIELTRSLRQIEDPWKALAGEEYFVLTQRIDEAQKNKAKSPNPTEAFGYHSAIANNQSDRKWVQVDLGQSLMVTSVQLHPCYDDFNSIGGGFGFPKRFKVEISDDPTFQSGVHPFANEPSETDIVDFKNPGLEPVILKPSKTSKKENGLAGRYIRVTATKLALRSNDFIFALAELQAVDPSGQNVANKKNVSALDSIEAAPRWSQTNLTDGVFPRSVTSLELNQWEAEREALLLKSASNEMRASQQNIKSELAMLEAELRDLPEPNLVYAGGIHEGQGNFVGTGSTGGKPRPVFVLARGQVTQPKHEVAPGSIAVFDFQPSLFALDANHNEGQRRIALAHWITDHNNPLTWRSVVNRVWQHHFGRGIVDTPNDFGRNGSLPSHPELLDWLARDFRDSGGSLKRLHKQIVLSKTYRQSSDSNSQAEMLDSENRLLWRQNRRRLEAEAIRDSLLAVSGKLDTSMGGPGWQDFVVEHPEHSPHYEYALADPEDTKTWRRSIYRFIVRSQTQPWMTSLDCADPSMRVDKRNESLSSIQALALLNNGFVLSQSKHFADRLAKESDDVSVQVERAYQLALGTSPPERRRLELIEFTKQNGLPYLCRLLFNLNAFTFVD
jgi:hypothetical protein